MYLKEKIIEIWKKYRALRYLFSGGTGFLVNVGFLYLLTDIFGVWYVLSGAIAFIVSITASFILHRTVTFEYDKHGSAGYQYTGFFVVSLINLLVNEGILVFSVEVLGLWYIIGQTIGSVVVAITGHFIYRYVIFREKVVSKEKEERGEEKSVISQ